MWLRRLPRLPRFRSLHPHPSQPTRRRWCVKRRCAIPCPLRLWPASPKALDADPHDTEQNIDAGTRLLKELLIKYDGDVVKALAAYNAGPGAVAKYSGLPPYRETQEYVNKVIRDYQKNAGQ
jgi:membrane-bound lytic murein transglycosylase MltF